VPAPSTMDGANSADIADIRTSTTLGNADGAC
jgi:hypothetical protein